MEKLTKRDYFNRILTYVHDEDRDFILHEIELLDRKNASRSNKPTAKQTANAELMSLIYEAMDSEKSYTATEIGALVPELADAKIQKITALISKMRENLLVSRRVVKGKAYFTKI